MFETHVALIVAVVALIVAVRRQSRLPTYRLEWNDISARTVYAKHLVLKSESDDGRTMHLYVDKEDRSVIRFPENVIDGERWEVSARCGRGLGGFRVEFFLHPRDDLPRQFIALGFAPSDATIIETQPKLKMTPPHVLVFDAKNTVIAQLP